MTNMTLSISGPMYKEMKRYAEVRWSEVARNAIKQKLAELELMDKILENSKLTEVDAELIGHKIKAEIRKRFK
jgi:predicted CopG family antitoxin